MSRSGEVNIFNYCKTAKKLIFFSALKQVLNIQVPLATPHLTGVTHLLITLSQLGILTALPLVRCYA